MPGPLMVLPSCNLITPEIKSPSPVTSKNRNRIPVVPLVKIKRIPRAKRNTPGINITLEYFIIPPPFRVYNQLKSSCFSYYHKEFKTSILNYI